MVVPEAVLAGPIRSMWIRLEIRMQEADPVARGSAGNPAPPLDDIDRFDGLVTQLCPVSATVIVAGTRLISVLVNTTRRCQCCVSVLRVRIVGEPEERPRHAF